MLKYALLKKQEIQRVKTISWILSGTVKIKIKIAHDTIQCLRKVVHYLNMKMPYILVEIIDF